MPKDWMNDFSKVVGGVGLKPELSKEENKKMKNPKSKGRLEKDTPKEIRNSNNANRFPTIANLGYSFQTQDYYGLNTDVEEDVKNIINYRLDNVNKNSDRQKVLQDLTKAIRLELEPTFFKAKVMYPGLVVGMSNPTMCSIKQNTEGSDDEKSNKTFAFKTGFTFDYVTGLPYIPGSSVKGMLRYAIKKYGADVKKYLKDEKKYPELKEMETIIEELFGDNTNNADPKYTNTMLRDIFLEAIVVKGDEKGYILKEDYITPHKTPFTNPKPIHILALRPNVEMEFYFILRKEEIAGLSAETRFELYKELILELGIGAKTNTGYGNLVEVEAETEITQGEK